MLRLASIIFVLVCALSSSAAPRRLYNRQHRWADRHRGNATSFTRCGRPSDGVSNLPAIPTTESTFTYVPPSSSEIDPIPTTSADTGITFTETASEPLVTTTSELASEVSSESSLPTLAETSSTSSPTDSAAPSGSTTLDSDVQAWLDGHNSLRQQHGASDLTWSETVAASAQSLANGCVFEHSGGPYGENLYAGTGDASPTHAVDVWGAEVTEYDPSNPVYSHFTQMVWKSTTELGCAAALCDGIFDASYGKATYYVCQYNPPGNVIGQFAENVQV